MKTSCLKQSKIEASIEYDITMSTPVMTGRTLPLPMTNENQFQSPAFLLTPIVSKMKMGKNEDVSSALQSLKGMVGMTPSAKRDQMLMTPKNVQKGFKGDINEMGFRSELIRGRVLPNNQNMNSFLYQNKIVKPKTTCEQLKKIETDKNEERNGFEENKVFDGEEKNHVAPKKEEERVSNVKSKLKNLEL